MFNACYTSKINAQLGSKKKIMWTEIKYVYFVLIAEHNNNNLSCDSITSTNKNKKK